MKDDIAKQWYPLRVTYGREMKLKSLLDSIDITNFVPMQYKEAIVKGRETNLLVPAIRNLIFVKSDLPTLMEIKIRVEASTPFRLIMDKATKIPIVIPTSEMENFIAVAGTLDEQIIYLTKIEPTLRDGDKVLVTGGIFNGVQGSVVRIKRNRRVVVSINGIAAVATAYINPLLLKKI